MWMNLAWGLPYFVAVVTGAIVCAVAGPKGPGTRTWRVPGVLGFGLLVLQHLVQTGQTMMLYSGAGPSGYFGRPWYFLVNGFGAALTIAGLVLLAVAVVRGRTPRALPGSWQPQAAEQGQQAPYGQPAPAQPGPARPTPPPPAPSTDSGEHRKSQ